MARKLQSRKRVGAEMRGRRKVGSKGEKIYLSAKHPRVLTGNDTISKDLFPQTLSKKTGSLIKNVSRFNFSNVEIEVFFSRFDIDGKFIYNPDDEESGENLFGPFAPNFLQNYFF